MKQIVENIKELTPDDRIFITHCLISSLESKQDDNAEEAWSELAEKRFSELESGSIQGVTWDEIKRETKG